MIRDIFEFRMDLYGFLVIFLDMVGLCDSVDLVEVIGV